MKLTAKKKVGRIRGFTSNYVNEVDLVVDMILKINELVGKFNILVEEVDNLRVDHD